MSLPEDPATHWTRARDLFLDLADREPDERARALGELADDDPRLEAFVRQLLEEDEPEPAPGPGIPSLGLPSSGPPTLDAPAETAPGPRVGPYELLERLGEGGFGTVHRARQHHPIEREVALKVLKPGLDSPQLLARFADERRYLARIDHPDVVKVLDAGATPEGQLYVAMELVPGEPVDRYVERHGLSLEARVELLARVARAVHHVHQRAIVHRDLKPNNILVQAEDGGHRPRIIDFGIATAVSNADRAGWTALAGPICTPGYASPEQLEGDGDVDVRTDIYALGCVLCQCLAGDRPREATRRVERPVTAPSELAARRADPETARRLRGDLDRIVLKCVAWDPELRYESAAALAADLERYLRSEPVLATPPGKLYLLRKFVARNRLAVGISLAAVLSLVIGTVVALQGRRVAVREGRAAEQARDRADEQAARARRATAFLLADLFDRLDLDQRQQRPVNLLELLDGSTRKARESFAGDPFLLTEVMTLIGRSYAKAGYVDEGLAAFLEAADAAAEAHGAPSPELFEVRMRILDLLFSQGREDYLTHLERTRAEAKQLFEPGDVPQLRLDLRSDVGIEEVERIVGVLRDLPEPPMEDVLFGLRLLALHHRFGGDPVERARVMEELYDLAARLRGPDHSSVIEIQVGLAAARRRLGLDEDLLAFSADALERARRVLSDEHETTLLALRDHALLLGDLGRPGEGLEFARRAERGRVVLNGDGSLQHTNELAALGELLRMAGRPEEALPVQRRVLELRAEQWSDRHPMRVSALRDLAVTLLDLGRWDEAASHLRDARARVDDTDERAAQLEGLLAEARAGSGGAPASPPGEPSAGEGEVRDGR